MICTYVTQLVSSSGTKNSMKTLQPKFVDSLKENSFVFSRTKEGKMQQNGAAHRVKQNQSNGWNVWKINTHALAPASSTCSIIMIHTAHDRRC